MHFPFEIINIKSAIVACIALFLVYCFFISLFYRSIAVWSDPLHMYLILLSLYSTGTICSILIIKPNPQYYLTLLFIFIYMVIGSIASKGCLFKTNGLAFSEKIQLRFCSLLMIIFISALIINYLLGYIPLLHGSETRYLVGRNSRLLYWLLYSTNGYPIILLALTDYKSVKIRCTILLLIYITIGILSASRGFIVLVLLMIIFYNYLVYLREMSETNTERMLVYKLSRKRNINLLMYSIVLFFFLNPFYLLLIRTGKTFQDSIIAFFARLFLGFDQLFFIIYFNLDFNNKGLSLIEFYFLPFLKMFNYKPTFNNVSEYLFFEIFGSFSSSYETLLPNTNLIMEVIYTNGLYIGGLLLCIFSYLNFYVRKIVLSKGKLKLADLIIFNYFAMTPLWWLLSGAEFFLNLIISLILYLMINFYCNIRGYNFWYKCKFRFF